MAAGFYLRDVADFERWKAELAEMEERSGGDKFIFTVFEKEPELPQDLLDKLDQMDEVDQLDGAN